MTRYFALIDDRSDKFWKIIIQDSSFTVIFGRTGTAGQSQTKTFDTADRCQQEVAKLIREKTNKGYVESVNGVVVATPSQLDKQLAQPDDQQAVDAILNRYDEIIRNTQTDKLLPFLKSVDKRYYPALRKKIKEAKKYWCEWAPLGADEYRKAAYKHYDRRMGVRGNHDQACIIDLSALALLTQKEVSKITSYRLIDGQKWDAYVLPVLRFARHGWLTNYILANRWFVTYPQLRLLEQEGLVHYDSELFSSTVAHFRSAQTDSLGFLTDDPSVLTREIPALFDYPIVLSNNYDTVKMPDGGYEQVQLWPQAFTRLLAEGKLDRLWFLERCLSVQTKDWKADLRSFWRKQFEAATPTLTELLALQTDLFPLLAAQHPHVVNWAVGLLKAMYTEPGFRVSEMLDWASSVMMRDDCKTALKTLLVLFERLLKAQPNHCAAITNQLADVFVVNELSLQTKAAQLLTKYAEPSDADLQSRLQIYAGQMLGNVANDLKAFLTDAPNRPGLQDLTGSASPALYQYTPKLVPKLVPGQEVRLPETWNDFVFLIGKYFHTDDPLDLEILMNALIIPPADKPTDFREQLAVYGNKLEKMHGSPTMVGLGLGHYLRYWLSGSQDEAKFQYNLKQIAIANQSSLTNILDKRLTHLHQKCKNKSGLPLLSLPTHAPHWIAPKILINRLLAYQQTGESVDPVDLAIAIARMPREEMAEAVVLCDELDDDLAPLMRYCLGASNQLELPTATTLNRLSAVFEKTNQRDDLIALWAVAARTYGPDKEFPEFLNTALADVPNVVMPYAPWSVSKPSSLSALPEAIRLLAPKHTTLTSRKPSPILVYSAELYQQEVQGEPYLFRWHFEYISKTDLTYCYSLTAQYPEPLFTLVAKCGGLASENAHSVTFALYLMLQPGFQFREMSMLVLACGLLAKKRETVALAAEVVIYHFSEQTIHVVQLADWLGWLLSYNYAPLQRLNDALSLVRDVSPLHNKALLLVLDALFAQFALGAELPKNTKKLLELYLDLLVKVGESPSAATSVTLVDWQQNVSLKKICAEILSQK